jgi:hypothetical protein
MATPSVLHAAHTLSKKGPKRSWLLAHDGVAD